MGVAGIGDLCKNVDRATEQVHAAFRGPVETIEVLIQLWLLQDALAHVVEALNDHSTEIEVPGTGLTERVVDVLKEVENFHFGSLPAVQSACAAVNRSLLALEQRKGKLRGEAAEFSGEPKKARGLQLPAIRYQTSETAMPICQVEVTGSDGRVERLEIEAASLFDAGYRALQRFAVRWWWDSSKPITVKCNGQAWRVQPARLSEWKRRQGRH